MNLITRTPRPFVHLKHGLIYRVFIAIFSLAFVSQSMASLDKDVVQRIKRSTVRIVEIVDDEITGKHGSGFIISKDGHIATNRHVIDSAEKALVIFCDEDKQKVFLEPAEFVCVSQTADLAIIRIKPIPGTEVVTLSTSEPLAGQSVSSVGFPGAIDKANLYEDGCLEMEPDQKVGKIIREGASDNFMPAIFDGTVAKMMSVNDVRNVIHSAKISGGNSGGPLIDVEGRVCGINTSIIPAGYAGADYAFAIHASVLVGLAAERNIKVIVDRSQASAGGRSSPLILTMILLVGALAVVSFLLALRKPRTVMVDSLSKFYNYVRSGHPVSGPRPVPGPAGHAMRLSGHSPDGRIFDVEMLPAQFASAGGRLVIGRNRDLCGVVVSHDSISRQHATLTLRDGELWIEDRNSGNGTAVNGKALNVGEKPARLRKGDRLTLGELEFILH